MKVALVTGTRPQIIKSTPLLQELWRESMFDLKFIHTGQHYDNNMFKDFIRDFELRQPFNLSVMDNFDYSFARTVSRLLRLWDNEKDKPDIAIVPGDSVMPNTPVLIRRDSLVEIIPIEDLFWSYSDRRKIRELKNDIEIWTDVGWSRIKHSFRHKVKKIGYRILTDKGYVEVTDDHSLIIDNKKVSPKELRIGDKIERYRPFIDVMSAFDPELAWVLGLYAADGTRGIYRYDYGDKCQWRIANKDVDLLTKAQKILQSVGFESKIIYANDGMRYLAHKENCKRIYEYFDMCHSRHNGEKIISKYILNANIEAQKAFFDGYMAGDGHISENEISFCSIDYSLLEGLTFILDKLGKDYYLGRRSDKLNIIRIRIRKSKKVICRVPLEIISIEKFDIDDFVFDVETENHHFCGGIGGILLHNTDSAFAAAYAANTLKIPVVHVESGVREYDMTMREERNRRMIDHSAALLCVSTRTGWSNLVSEQVLGKMFLSGDTNYDLFMQRRRIFLSKEMDDFTREMYGADGDYGVLTIHREANTDFDTLRAIFDQVNSFGKLMICPMHPRTKKVFDNMSLISNGWKNYKFISPVPYDTMMNLIARAKIVVTDSGGLQKEAYFTNTPCVTLREVTAWTETVEYGANVLVGTKNVAEGMEQQFGKELHNPRVFGDGSASGRIVDIILNNEIKIPRSRFNNF